jgi:hypothetical protein
MAVEPIDFPFLSKPQIVLVCVDYDTDVLAKCLRQMPALYDLAIHNQYRSLVEQVSTRLLLLMPTIRVVHLESDAGAANRLLRMLPQSQRGLYLDIEHGYNTFQNLDMINIIAHLLPF